MKYKVSVAILTYNHEKYIAQAIESVLMQEVSFDYEIIIAEDCSTDNTREIVKDFKNRYPDKIKLILQEKNSGVLKNEYDMLSSCQGEYIALLEGDDAWIDKDKLQMQVDFLDNNKDYSSCFTNTKVLSDVESMIEKFSVERRDICSYEEYFSSASVIPTGTFMFKNVFWGNDLRYLYKGPKFITDRILMCLSLSLGKIKYIDKKTSIYRFIMNGKDSFTSHDIIFKISDYVRSLRVQLKIVPEDKKYLVNEDIIFNEKVVIKKYFEQGKILGGLLYWLFEVKLIEKIRMLYYKDKKELWEIAK